MWNMYIPQERTELVADSVCEQLGHFYENYECIYCPARYCQTEHGGHSFERDGYTYVNSPIYCHYCSKYRVNISKGRT